MDAYRDHRPRQCITQALQIAQTVAVIKNARHPVVAALHDILRHTCKIGTRKSGHAPSFPSIDRRLQSVQRESKHRKLLHAREKCCRYSNKSTSGLKAHRATINKFPCIFGSIPDSVIPSVYYCLCITNPLMSVLMRCQYVSCCGM